MKHQIGTRYRQVLRPMEYVAKFLADADRCVESAMTFAVNGELSEADDELRELIDFLRRAEAEAQSARRTVLTARMGTLDTIE